MWIDLYITAFACVAFAYVPGYVVLRAFRVGRSSSLACAPLFDTFVYGVLGIVYSKVGVSSSWASLSLPILAVGVVLHFARAVRGRGIPVKGEGGFSALMRECTCRKRVAVFVLYVVIGIIVTSVVFIGSLDSPGSFAQEFDNIHHLGITQAFLSWGDWSSLDAVLYPTPADQAINPLPESSYYPSAWNILAAMGAQITGVSAPVAVNAINFAICAFVFPASMCCFMDRIFRDRLRITVFGSFACLAFAAFPWAFFVFGPLYPNMLGFALLPVLLAMFITVFESGASPKRRIQHAALFLLGIASCAFSQPNAVFSAAALLAPFCVWKAMAAVDSSALSPERKPAARTAAGLVCAAAIITIWVAAYNLPFLQGVVQYNWPAFRSLDGGFADIASGALRLDAPQACLMACAGVGVLATFFDRKRLWLSIGFFLACLIYVVDVSSDGYLKHLLSGFWYTDSLRVAAFLAISAVPLVAMGLDAVASGLSRLFRQLVASHLAQRVVRGVLCAVIGLGFVCIVYSPMLSAGLALGSAESDDGNASDSQGAFPHMIEVLARMNDSQADDIYDSDERAFVEEVIDAVPSGSLIVNVPDDGSAFAYSVDGANVYYRYLRTYGVDYETSESVAIRNGLANYEEDESVRDAVEAIGAEYVLLLDQGDEGNSDRSRRYLFTYEDGKNWQGILSITDETPGFEVVLAEGDMRLYRILDEA